MKRILMGGLLLGIGVYGVSAKTPATFVEVVHPATSVTVVHPVTKVDTVYPATSVEVIHATTQTGVFHPQTDVEVVHPATQVEVFHPQTTVTVIHPQTTVEVFHPQTSEEVNGKQGGAANMAQRGENTLSSKIVTSMSDFKPMQAKDLSAKPSADKAAPMGGGSKDLGNNTNQAEKDNANKSSMLGMQKSAENIEVDPKQNKLDGLEKLLTDRAKFEEKRK